MPLSNYTTAQQSMAFHLIAQVESNHDWSSVEYDQIGQGMSIGIIQEYAYNIKPLMQIIKQNYPDLYSQYIPTQYQDRLVTLDDNSWPGWKFPDDLWNGVKQLINTDQGRASQIAHWNQLVNEYTNWLDSNGYTLDAKAWIYFISMYHQSPASATAVIRSTGTKSPTVSQLYNACMSNSVLSHYSNRYNYIYEQLQSWDGTSAPTDGCDITKTEGIDWGGSGSGSEGGSQTGGDLPLTVGGIGKYIIQMGNDLYLITGDTKTQFRKVAGQVWMRQGSQFESGTMTSPPNSDGSYGNAASNCDVIDWARKILEKYSYVYGGPRTYEGMVAAGGTDCSGFVSIAFQEVRDVFIGYSTADQATSSTQTDVCSARSWDSLDWSKMQCGDLIYMTRDSSTSIASGRNSHVAIYTGSGRIVIDAGSTPLPREHELVWSNPSYILVRRVIERGTVNANDILRTKL